MCAKVITRRTKSVYLREDNENRAGCALFPTLSSLCHRPYILIFPAESWGPTKRWRILCDHRVGLRGLFFVVLRSVVCTVPFTSVQFAAFKFRWLQFIQCSAVQCSEVQFGWMQFDVSWLLYVCL